MFHRAQTGNPIFPRAFTQNDSVVAHRISKLWCDFIHGILDEETWPLYGKEESEAVLMIGDERDPRVWVSHKYKADICTFWNMTYPKYASSPLKFILVYLDRLEAHICTLGFVVDKGWWSTTCSTLKSFIAL
jgi:hypothetical protein